MDNVFVTADVIGCIVEPHDFVLINAPVVDDDGIPVEVNFIFR
jgi:hypothetical protein